MYASKEKISTHCAICMKRYVNEYFFHDFFPVINLYGALGYLADFAENFFLNSGKDFLSSTGFELME